MTITFLVALGATALFLAKRWRDSCAENVDLRNQVASLKRQLRRVNRPEATAR